MIDGKGLGERVGDGVARSNMVPREIDVDDGEQGEPRRFLEFLRQMG